MRTFEKGRIAIGQQIQLECGAAAFFDLIPQGSREFVDQTAFDAVLSDDELAGFRAPLKRQRNGFDRLARKTAFEMLTPLDVETAIGRLERLDVDAAPLQDGDPGAGRACFLPATATERKDAPVCFR